MTGDLCRFLVQHMGVVEHLSVAAFRENLKEPTKLVRELDRYSGLARAGRNPRGEEGWDGRGEHCQRQRLDERHKAQSQRR